MYPSEDYSPGNQLPENRNYQESYRVDDRADRQSDRLNERVKYSRNNHSGRGDSDTQPTEGPLAREDSAKEHAVQDSVLERTLNKALHLNHHPEFSQILRIPDLIEVLSPLHYEKDFTESLKDELDFFSPSFVVQGNYHNNPEGKIYSALTKEMNRVNKTECRKLAHYVTSLVELQTLHTDSPDFTLALRTTPPGKMEEAFPGAGFHLDLRTKRLLSTLVGPGMEWVLPEEVNPEQLELVMKGKDSSTLFREGAAIKQTNPTDVVLFTGNRLPHRPPITTERRLLCVIDSP